MASGTVGRGKNKWVAVILCWLLGSLGIHHFYLGSTMAGVICLLTCGGCAIIQVVELIMLLVMSEEDFNKKYNFRTPESMEFVWTKAK
jgi:TM2 domain-containing membrane protein YozV